MKLLGEYLRELTSLTTEDLVEALRHQVNLKDKGDSSHLGAILIALGLATEEEVASALSLQEKDKAAGNSGAGLVTHPGSYWVSRGQHQR